RHLWSMGDVTVNATVSLPGGDIRPPIIWRARNNASSNNPLVSVSSSVQFSRGYRRGYDRDH
ncbi:hypothetical protein, partial [Mycobacterium sp.]|uniref:hypothetical protein n=1 Tax=Mycobacterium sp. TaxID=1785 RepID=UPI003BB0F566